MPPVNSGPVTAGKKKASTDGVPVEAIISEELFEIVSGELHRLSVFSIGQRHAVVKFLVSEQY